MAIEPTAALTAVDVDYGGASGGAKRLNRLAVTELARQLRLRNLSGAIVIDLVGQPRGAEARNLKRTLEQAVADDPLRVDVGAVSRLGLLEISRQRVHPPLHELAMQPSGPVLRTHSALLAAMRQAQEAWQMVPGRTIGLHASADLIEALKTRFAPLLGELESTTHGQIRLVPHPEWTCGRFEIVANAAAHE